jgi:RNA polymerase sigma factor (sigma-70 family)
MRVYAELNDQELLLSLKSGDETAFNAIFKRHWKALYDEAYKRLRNQMQSEEIVQDVFADLWIKREMQKIENLLPYLRTAVKYQVFMLYKKFQQLPKFEEPLDFFATASLQADSEFSAKELRGCIDSWLEMQPEKRREIFRLRFIEEFSTKEISEQLHISQKTVQNTLAIALLSLRECLGITLTVSLIFSVYLEATIN